MTVSRRSLLSSLGFAAAAPAIAMARSAGPEEPKGYFEHPSEYLAAMQAIGWAPVAMYHQRKDGSVHPMGVAERGGDTVHETWRKFQDTVNARVPVQRAADLPQGDWWQWVWQYLYDKGLREDVTPPKRAARSPNGKRRAA